MATRGQAELFQWLDKLHRFDRVINGSVRTECVALAQRNGWGIDEFQVALSTNNRQLAHQLKSVEYAALLRSWRRDFGSPAASPRVRQLGGQDSCGGAPSAPRYAPVDQTILLDQADPVSPSPSYRRGHLGVGRQPTSYPEDGRGMPSRGGMSASSPSLSNGGGYPQAASPNARIDDRHRGAHGRSPSEASLASSRVGSMAIGRDDRDGYGCDGGGGLMVDESPAATAHAGGGAFHRLEGQPGGRQPPIRRSHSAAGSLAGDVPPRGTADLSSRRAGQTSPLRAFEADGREPRPYGTNNVVLHSPVAVSEELDMVCRNLGRQIENRFSNMRACVRYLDLDRTGKLNREKIQQFFRSFHQSKRSADELFDYLCQPGTRETSVDSFVQFIWAYVEPAVQKPPAPVRRQPGAVPPKVQHVLESFGEKAASRFKNARELFRFIDQDSSGGLSRSEVHKVFKNFNLSQEMADVAYDYCNPQGVGEVAYTTFATFMSPYVRAGHGELNHETVARVVKEPHSVNREVEQLLAQVGEKAHEKFPSLRDCFLYADADKDGRLSFDEAGHLFRRLGVRREDCDRLFDIMDQDRRGFLTFEDFQRAVGRYLQPGYLTIKTPIRNPGDRDREFPTGQIARPPELREICNKLGPKVFDKDKRVELRKICEAVGDKALTRFRQQRDVLKLLEPYRGKSLSCSDVEQFFTKVYLSAEMGRRLFEFLDTEGTGKVSWVCLLNTLGPHVLPGYRPLTPEEPERVGQ